jgi:hypothetical protein
VTAGLSPDTFEIATGGHPQQAAAEALTRLRLDGGVYRMGIAHDDNRPCLTHGRPLHGCTCEIIRIVRRRLR